MQKCVHYPKMYALSKNVKPMEYSDKHRKFADTYETNSVGKFYPVSGIFVEKICRNKFPGNFSRQFTSYMYPALKGMNK